MTIETLPQNTTSPTDAPYLDAARVEDVQQERRIEDVNVWDGTDVLDLIEASNADDTYYQYSQNIDPLKMFCTVMWPWGMTTSYWNEKKDYNDHLALFNYAAKHFGYRKNVWHATNNGVNCVRSYWNANNPDRKVVSFRTTIWSPIFRKALEKKIWVTLTYRGNWKYNKDRNDDKILDLVSLWGAASYAHCKRSRALTNIHGREMAEMVDSYVGRDSNVSYIPYENWGALVRNNVYWAGAYIIVPLKPILDKTGMPEAVFKDLMHIKNANSFIRNKLESLQTGNKLSDEDNRKLDSMQDHYHKINNTIRSIEG